MHFQNPNLQSGLTQPWSYFLVPFSTFISFLVMLIKYSEKSNLQLKNFVLAHSLRVQFIKAGNLRKQVLEALGHIVFPIRKQSAMNTRCCSALFCYLCGPESQPQDGATHSGWVFQSQHYEKNLPQACPEDHSLTASRVCQVISINYQSEISLYDSSLISIARYA